MGILTEMYGILAEDDNTYYLESKSAKDAFFEYLKWLNINDSLIENKRECFDIEELVKLFNEYNHNGYEIKAIFCIGFQLVGTIKNNLICSEQEGDSE